MAKALGETDGVKLLEANLDQDVAMNVTARLIKSHKLSLVLTLGSRIEGKTWRQQLPMLHSFVSRESLRQERH